MFLERDLKQERDYLLNIINHQTEMLIRWKSDGTITFVNDPFCQRFGIAKVDIVGKDLFRVAREEDLDIIIANTGHLTPGSPTSSGLFRIELPDGQITQQRWTARAFFNEKGHAVEYQSEGSEIQEIQELELLDKIILESAGIGVFEYFPGQDKYYFNSRFSEIFGIDEQSYEDITTEFFGRIHKEDRERVQNHHRERLRTNGPGDLNIEYRIVVKGVIKYILGHGRVFRDASGEVQREIGIVQDITPLRESEMIMKSNEKLFRSIVQDQTEMIVRWKGDGILLFVNDSYCKTFGREREELLGRSFFDMIDKEHLESVKKRLGRLTPENPVSSDLHKVRLPDGKIGWQHWTDRALFDRDGRLTEYQSVGRDITIEIMARQREQESEHRLSVIFENTSDMMALIRCEEDQFLLEAMNEAYLNANNLFGSKVRREMLIGKEMSEVYLTFGFPEDLTEEKMNRLEQARSSQQRIEFLEVNVLNNQTVYGNAQLIPIIEKGVVSRILWSSRDVTSAKNYEIKLEDTVRELNELKQKLEAENVYLRKSIDGEFKLGDLIYASQSFHEVVEKVRQVASLDTTVLLTGETGTGKEVIASAIHNLSDRSDKPMIRVNCGAIPRDLIESELFGYEKGAFTGAHQSKPGRFLLADGGTILLDEIGEMPLETQVKLLRVIQNSEIEPLGAVRTKRVNVRIIAATNRDLEKEIKNKTFREDLFYRLNVFPIHLPPLRERKEDIPVLLKHFIDKFSKKYDKKITSIPKKAMDYFYTYGWPGNIRELENLIERSVILTNSETLRVPDLDGDERVSIDQEFMSLDEAQKQHILMVLQATNWKIEGEEGAAAKLGLHPSTLRDRMKKLRIKRSAKIP